MGVSKGGQYPPASVASLRPSLRQDCKGRKVSAHIGFLLGSRPTLDPPLGGDRIGDPLVVLSENKLHGAAHERIAVGNQPLRMLTYSLLERSACDSCVIAAVRAFEDIYRCPIQAWAPCETIYNRPSRGCATKEFPPVGLRTSFETPAARLLRTRGRCELDPSNHKQWLS